MATPFDHAHVSYLPRTGRRRSQSVTIPKTNPQDTPGLNSQQKQFLAQLQKERQKYLKKNNERLENVEDKENENEKENEDHSRPVITRVEEIQISPSAKVITAPLRKKISSKRIKTALSIDEEERPTTTVVRVPRTAILKSGKNQSSLEGPESTTIKNESSSISSDHPQEDDYNPKQQSQPQIIRVPRVESTISVKKQMSFKTIKSSNVTVTHTSKTSNLESSQGSSHPFLSSSNNLMCKSDIFDQDSCPNDDVERGKVNISENKKHKKTSGSGIIARSSGSSMASIIGLVLGIIAFAFGLTSLILIQLLRSTVNNELAAYSTTTQPKYSSSWQTACSSYTTVNDPTRSIYAAGYPLGCDNTLPFLNQSVGTWIRFTGSGGTQLPLVTPGLNICGTVGTGYYDDVMPSPGELVNGTVCFTWYGSVCRFSQIISVANCDSYYVYFLPPAPACMMRYCTI